MKKILAVLLGTTFLVAGCGDSKQTVSQSEEKVEQEEKIEEDKANAMLEVDKSGSSIWGNTIDDIWVNSAALYKNTGEVPVEIGETQMNYVAKDGSILGTSTMIYSVPKVVLPGETAIIGEATILESITALEDFDKTTFNFNFNPTDEDPNLMEVSNVKAIEGDYNYSVTGMVKNPTSEQQEDVRLAAILYDEAGAILGALTGSVDVGLAPNGEAGFELSYPPLPEDIGSKLKNIEVKSYGFKW